MKKNIIILSIVMFVLASCATPLSTRMESYIDEVEKNCTEWTEDDWTLSQQEYEQLLQEYKENYSSYTQEEKDAINRAIGRYNGLLIRHGIEEAGDVLKEIGERLPALIDGFMSAFEIDENQ